MSTTNTSEDSTFDSNLTELFLSSVRPKDVYDEIQKVNEDHIIQLKNHIAELDKTIEQLMERK